jgi:hypothetical protein
MPLVMASPRPRITDDRVNPDGTVEWRHAGLPVRPKLRPVTSALFDKRWQVVFLLLGEDRRRALLVGLDGAGHERFRVRCPAGYTFAYLTSHPLGPAVVCGANRRVQGFRDWQFLIDRDTGRLARVDPAY